MPPEFVETSTRGEQFVDRPVLNDSAIFEEEDMVGMTNVRHPMGDGEVAVGRSRSEPQGYDYLLQLPPRGFDGFAGKCVETRPLP
jgi:hypothetical protein